MRISSDISGCARHQKRPRTGDSTVLAIGGAYAKEEKQREEWAWVSADDEIVKKTVRL